MDSSCIPSPKATNSQCVLLRGCDTCTTTDMSLSGTTAAAPPVAITDPSVKTAFSKGNESCGSSTTLPAYLNSGATTGHNAAR